LTSYRPDKKEQLFVCIYRMNADPPKLPISAEALHHQHRDWLQGLADKNILVGSGPARDEAGRNHAGSVIILRAESFAAAQALAAEEPNAREGQRLPEVVPWHRMWFED
jgi:uncharacterized protein YciI